MANSARPAVFAPRAQHDLLEAIRWIAKDNPVAATGLRHAIVNAAHRIGAHPGSGVMRLELADEPIRFLPMNGFPYVIVYDAAEVPPLILRVLHGARDLPGLLHDL